MSIVKALSLLRPYDINIPKVRIGPEGDGGYILADMLDPKQDVLSYGISTEFRFDEEMGRRGHRVFMFDHTIDGIVAISDKMRWWKEGVGAKDDPDHALYTIENQVKRHNVNPENLIMKMDVEGSEYGALRAIDVDLFGKFSQIVVEFHNLRRLVEPGYCMRFIQLFEKINSHFTLFHVHGNNYDGPAPQMAGNIPVSNLVELSYIRNDLVSRRPSETVYPTDLDYPNTDQAEKLLWYFPFLPTNTHDSAFEVSAKSS